MTFQRKHLLGLALLGSIFNVSMVHAQNFPEQGSSNSTSNDQYNATHWGLGAGVGVQGLPYKGYSDRVSPVPYVFFTNRWVSFAGTTLDLKPIQTEHFSVSLRARYSLFDGYKSSDSDIFRGMDDRKGSLLFGPHVSWHQGEYGVNADWLTGSRGSQASLSLERGFTFGRLHIAPYAELRYQSSKYVNYYYGVRSDEVAFDRPFYDGKSTVNETLGINSDWHITSQQSIRFNLGVTHFGSGITDSPLTERKFSPSVQVGYVYRFK